MTTPVVARIDLAPALLTIQSSPDDPGTVYDGTRVIVSIDTVYVFRDAPTGPYLYTQGLLDSFDGRNTTGYVAVTSDGRIFTFRRSTGCACGSQIRSFRPFPQGVVQGPYPVQ